MPAVETSQDPTAVITYLDNWTNHLAAAGRTIVSATVVASDGASVSGVNPTATGVAYRLTVAGVANPPKIIIVTMTVTLDNGDVDVRHHRIQVTDT